MHHVGRHLAIAHWGERHRLRAHVLVGVEAAEGDDVGQTRNLDDWALVHLGLVLHWVVLPIVALVVSLLEVAALLLCLVVFEFLRHGRQSDTVRQVGQGVDELSPLGSIVEERAAFSELALASLGPVLAGFSLVVGVDCSQSSLAEVLGQWLKLKVRTIGECTYVVGRSEFGGSVGELAELDEGAHAGVEEVLAHLGLVLLLEGVELTVVAVEVVVVRLLGQMSHHLAWRVVEVLLGLTVGTQLSSVLGLGVR